MNRLTSDIDKWIKLENDIAKVNSIMKQLKKK